MTELDLSQKYPPCHYDSKIQPIDFIEAHGLNFSRGNVVKYVTRAGKKEGEPELRDLEKARWYIEREIERARAAND